MKRGLLPLLLLLLVSSPCLAERHFSIEVLQVTNIPMLDLSYKGFLEELGRHGLVEGENLTVRRHIIDADADAGLWKKIMILHQIKKTAGEIASAKPDLALTMTTPGTKYGMEKILEAGIPRVFTAVAYPPAVGCASLEKAGEGFTGASLYSDPEVGLKIAQLALPQMHTMGLVHSDDDNAIVFAKEAHEKAAQLGITLITREVGKSDDIKPAVRELLEAGIDSIGIPPDTYYALRDCQPSRDLISLTRERKIPIIIFASHTFKGGILYVGPDFGVVGGLSGQNAARILLEGVRPEELPVLKQEDLNILVDLEAAKTYGIELPLEILQIARPI